MIHQRLLICGFVLGIGGCREPASEAETASSTVSPTRATQTSSPTTTSLRVNDDGEVMFKIVIVAHAGAVDFVRAIHQRTREEHRGELREIEEAAWHSAITDFRLAEFEMQGRPVRFYLFAHEGLGFIGQPGSAKDVVYAGAHAVVSLAAGLDDARDLGSVIGADLERMRSQGLNPRWLLAAPTTVDVSANAEHITLDWRSAPLDLLRHVIRSALN